MQCYDSLCVCADDVDNGVYKVNVEIPQSRHLQSKSKYFKDIIKKVGIAIYAYSLFVCLFVCLLVFLCFFF
jgi:hypothetical protein